MKLIGVPSEQRSTREKHLIQLWAVLNNKHKFVCILSGAGDTGNIEVTSIMRHYSKLVYNELVFTKRTIVIRYMTGSAAVIIHGETMYSNCNLNSKLGTYNDWDNTTKVALNEISFIKRPYFWKLDKVLNAKCDASIPSIFGNLQMVFAGGFCQLKPPNNSKFSLYLQGL